MLLILVKSRCTALHVDVHTPLLIYCEDGLHPFLHASVREQFSSHLGTLGENAFRQIIISSHTVINFVPFPTDAVCLGSDSTSCHNRLLSTPDTRPDHEETLRLESAKRKRLVQSCAAHSVTAPSTNTALKRRQDAVADSLDLKPYTRRPQMKLSNYV
ncbi:hypothetical protein Y032_0016g3160 [Ancylostoma ceylanicum]|uniref:Uncharacterized protein n=1 Tax=Ancylostoma ceylanicum TaxID=53326 RepID=A0A016V7D1_9BILA|nr:hypothetical protein Y032_0016g3160 [Ancylostoma ceylanicum]